MCIAFHPHGYIHRKPVIGSVGMITTQIVLDPEARLIGPVAPWSNAIWCGR